MHLRTYYARFSASIIGSPLALKRSKEFWPNSTRPYFFFFFSARGHELSGPVHTHAMPGLNAHGLQSKLITPLIE